LRFSLYDTQDNVLAFWRKGYTSLATFQGADVEELMEAGNITKPAAERMKRLLDEKMNVPWINIVTAVG